MPREFVLDFNLRKILMLSIFLACAISSTSCQKQNVSSFETNDETLIPREIPKDWQCIETDYFSFSIPPTMKRNNLHGTDSQMMGFESEEIYLELDYGMYYTNIEYESRYFKGDKKSIIIDGEKTILISFDENSPIPFDNVNIGNDSSSKFGTIDKHFIIGVNFPHESKVIAPNFRFAASFTAACKTLEAQEIAKTIFNSIKFKRQ